MQHKMGPVDIVEKYHFQNTQSPKYDGIFKGATKNIKGPEDIGM